MNKDAASHARRDQAHGADIDPSQASLPAPSAEAAPESDASAASPPPGDSLPQPPFLFSSATSLIAMTRRENLTIAQLVFENERSYMTADEISDGLLKIWGVMDGSIRDGVSSREEILPGGLGVRRRAAGLYRRLFKGFYPSISPSSSQNSLSSPARPSNGTLSLSDGFNSAPPPEAYVQPKRGAGRVKPRPPLVIGDFEHELSPIPWKTNVFPGIDFLSC